jgi:hypothetical protein
MYFLLVLLSSLIYAIASPITYADVRGTPYKVAYDHRAITINGVRTMLISGAIHYPRSTPGMWPYIMKMAKNQGLNTIQTYVFWNLHEQKQGVLDFSGRANLSRFLQEAANAGLFVNLRIGPYVCAEWDYGGLPVWLNQVQNISFRSSNPAWEAAMKKFILEIIDYVTPYLAKNGGPIILAQIENELFGKDTAYVNWCGDLVSNELASTEIPWIMCNGLAANSTIETCNHCNCFPNWMDTHQKTYPDKPMLFTENEGWFDQWGQALGIRTTSNLAYSVAVWFAAGGAYHAYYMWHGGNNYGRTAGSGVTTMYADDVCLHADGTPNEPKFTHLSRLQHLIADRAEGILSKDPNRTLLPAWNGRQWVIGGDQYLYSYPLSTNFVINQHPSPINVLFHNQNISMKGSSLRIYDDNMTLLWYSDNYSDIPNDNTEIIPIVIGPLNWQTWSESSVKSNLPVITSPTPLEQLNLTNDETIYLWYRRNVTLQQASATAIITVDTRASNALLFFLDGQYLGEFDDHQHTAANVLATVSVDLSHFKLNQQYLFEILSISLGIDNSIQPGHYDNKGIVGNVSLDGQQLFDNQTETNFWKHQKGLIGESLQIYTEQGSSKVNWDKQWTKGINQPITWFQARFDLDHLVKEDTNANPVLFDAQGLNRGHAFINGNDIGLYWLIQGICGDNPPCCCHQSQINCLKPTQRYYHIPSDWLMPKNNLITIFDDLGAPSPGSVGFVQRIITN